MLSVLSAATTAMDHLVVVTAHFVPKWNLERRLAVTSNKVSLLKIILACVNHLLVIWMIYFLYS